MKCTYKNCLEAEQTKTAEELSTDDTSAGIVDNKMRPFHHKCARAVLTRYSMHEKYQTIGVYLILAVIILSKIIQWAK